MRRILSYSFVLVALAGTGRAWAHEEINPPSVVTGRPVFLTLSAANEEGSAIARVTLNAPEGLSFGEATRQPPGWTAQKAEDSITWSGGSVPPGGFEEWGFEVEAVGQPGTFAYRVSLGFADGDSHDSEVVVTAVAAGGPTPPTTPTTGAAGPTTVPPATTAGPTPSADTDRSRESDDDSSGGALPISIAALSLALVALGTSIILGRRSVAGRPAEAGTEAGAGSGQDW